jgi:hypothetical protein
MAGDLVGKVGRTIAVTECMFYACCIAAAWEMLDGVYDTPSQYRTDGRAWVLVLLDLKAK